MKRIWSLFKKVHCVHLCYLFVFITCSANATGISSFELGRSGTFYPVNVMHGVYAFNQIKVVFDTDVHVDFYDLKLRAVAPLSCSIPLAGFSYSNITHTAVWHVYGQPTEQNERFQAVISGVWDTNSVPLAGGAYTNEFSILTCDVTGDDAVAPADSLALINHINSGDPYDPSLDVNFDGAISPQDSLIVINYLNANGSVLLIAPGLFIPVSRIPPPLLEFTAFSINDGVLSFDFYGLPVGSRLRLSGSTSLPPFFGRPLYDSYVTNGMSHIEILKGTLPGVFYKATFE